MPIPQSGFIIITGRGMLVNTARMQMRDPRGDVRTDHTPLNLTMCVCVCVGGGRSNCIGSCISEGWWVRCGADR